MQNCWCRVGKVLVMSFQVKRWMEGLPLHRAWREGSCQELAWQKLWLELASSVVMGECFWRWARMVE